MREITGPAPAETERPPEVQLKPLLTEDATYLYDLIKFDPGHIRSFDMGQTDFSSPEVVQKFIEQKGTDQKFKVQVGDQRIGALFINQDRSDPKAAYISYLIGKQFSGQGYGTEAVRQGVDFAFRDMNVEAVKAAVLDTNQASKRLLEKLDFELISKKRLYIPTESVWVCGYILFRADILAAAVEAAKRQDFDDF